MSEVGRVLVFLGIVITIMGILFLVFPKLNFKGLPGDIYIKKDNFVFFFPIVTSIVLSIVLSVILSMLFYLFRK